MSKLTNITSKIPVYTSVSTKSDNSVTTFMRYLEPDEDYIVLFFDTSDIFSKSGQRQIGKNLPRSFGGNVAVFESSLINVSNEEFALCPVKATRLYAKLKACGMNYQKLFDMMRSTTRVNTKVA